MSYCKYEYSAHLWLMGTKVTYIDLNIGQLYHFLIQNIKELSQVLLRTFTVKNWFLETDNFSGTKMSTRSAQERWCNFQKDRPTGSNRVDFQSFS